MSDVTARMALPILQAGQAQKEVFHNEALARVDALLHPVVATIATSVPPAAPVAGMCWIVAPGATGEWAAYGGHIAAWTTGGWRFVAPVPGMTAWLMDVAHWAWHDGNGWRGDAMPGSGVAVAGQRVVGARQPAIPDPVGGGIVDAEARAGVSAILVAMRAHGLIAA